MSEVEQNIVSVERILHYVKLTPEAPAEIPGTVPEDWPSEGEVEFWYVLWMNSQERCSHSMSQRVLDTIPPRT